MFTCGAKRYCREMASCAEARFCLQRCGLRRLDAEQYQRAGEHRGHALVSLSDWKAGCIKAGALSGEKGQRNAIYKLREALVERGVIDRHGVYVRLTRQRDGGEADA